MLHVRVVSPPDLTEQLIHALAEESAVRNVVVLSGAAQRPDGDAVLFDVLTRSANPVLRQLRDLHLDQLGSIIIDNVEAVIAVQASLSATRDSDTREAAPVWEMVEARIRAEGVYPPSFFILLAIAGLIGAVGILTNSQVLVVGAMVVGPEYSAIIAIALGLNRRDASSVRSGLFALLFGFLAAILVTLTASGLAVAQSGPARDTLCLGR